MRRDFYEFEDTQLLTAVAQGTPGNRTFFILVAHGAQRLRIALEKGQLQALADAIEQFIAGLPEGERPQHAPDAPETSDAGYVPTAEFSAQTLGIGWDEGQKMGILLVNEGDDDAITGPLLRSWTTLAQMQGFARRAAQVCAAGRPLCPLCGLPMNPDSHICPRTNGHHPAFRNG